MKRCRQSSYCFEFLVLSSELLTLIITYQLFESKWSSKQGSKTTTTLTNLALLSSSSLLLKQFLYYAATFIWKSRHWHLGMHIVTAIDICIYITAKILFLYYKCFYEKIGHLCQIRHSILSCTYLLGIRIILLQLLISQQFRTLIIWK